MELTATGGEGMVVKPAGTPAGRVQPGLKVRGRECLRLIYGPDYLDSLGLLRERNLGRKCSLALREHGLGAWMRCQLSVAGKPLWQVHQFCSRL